jgi:hypothetical protein
MSANNPFEFADLVTQLEALTRQVQVLQVQAVAPPVANDNARLVPNFSGLVSFRVASAAVKKAAHNAGRQAQRRLSKKNPNYTQRYKDAYDAHLNGAGFRGKYQEREDRRAATAARKAA